MDLLLSNQAKQEQMNFVGGPSQEVPPKVNEVDGLEGQEELCFINNNGTWYMKEPNFQYNNYQQRSYSNNQQGGYQPKQNTQQGSYQPRQNIPPGFSNHSNQSTQAQGSSSQAPASDTRNTRHQTRARKRSPRNDQTRVPLGRYVATELEPSPVAT
ncbi:hypothetical protein DY000_02039426 [Brassica cretica]|uniref:Uncharacterized protein n=1 Tax=Brassica cretica TaxID=69181 RepID=A0ABQ7BKE5_BRACR|nr:hypothetical protein DY000_02039426 [Brassica cretica]